MPGRKRKPTELKLLAGQGRRNKNGISEKIDPEAEPKAVLGRPKAPKGIEGEALEEWHRITDELYEMGILSTVYRASLVAYCTCWALYQELLEEYEYDGPLIEKNDGETMPNPIITHLNNTRTQVLRFLAEFGMTPSSKSRVRVEKPKEKDPFAKLQERMKGA